MSPSPSRGLLGDGDPRPRVVRAAARGSEYPSRRVPAWAACAAQASRGGVAAPERSTTTEAGERHVGGVARRRESGEPVGEPAAGARSLALLLGLARVLRSLRRAVRVAAERGAPTRVEVRDGRVAAHVAVDGARAEGLLLKCRGRGAHQLQLARQVRGRAKVRVRGRRVGLELQHAYRPLSLLGVLVQLRLDELGNHVLARDDATQPLPLVEHG